jgi:hypothetical protein
LDKQGKPQFRDPLFHRAEPYFCAFDLLMSDGKDLRMERITIENSSSDVNCRGSLILPGFVTSITSNNTEQCCSNESASWT